MFEELPSSARIPTITESRNTAKLEARKVILTSDMKIKYMNARINFQILLFILLF